MCGVFYRHTWRIIMANSNRNSLQIDDDTQEIMDYLDEDDMEEQSSSRQKQQAINDQKRGKVRRSIEEIKERKRLKELLGDDFDDYLDS